jgi:hypothetical protein
MTQFDKCPRCGKINCGLFASIDVYECKKCSNVVFCSSGKCDGRCPNCGSKDNRRKIGYLKG